MFTDLPNSRDPKLHGYQTPIFGRGNLKDKYNHSSGLFFPELTDKTRYFKNGSEIPKPGNCIACTFSFLTAATDPSLQERISYLKKKLQSEGAIIIQENAYIQKGSTRAGNQLSSFDVIQQCPTQIIEFKFSKNQEHIVRQAILSIDEAADGRISNHIKLGHAPLLKVA